ncbi:MAG: ABC transporter ATP-binding protein [Acidobacteria bacterium]|jgi:ABC-2 type transport system ATP-binding protein|nr:ABC transporter ATP-binding protein [Acidobacteriota bacterium]
MADEIIIKAEHVRKVYGETAAVNDISLEIAVGEIFGLVGPNGAGKTTFIECLEGLRKPDNGSIYVKGMDPFKYHYQLSPSIGIQFQESELQPHIKVWEAVDLYAAFYSNHADRNKLLQQLGLADQKNKAFAKLSGGQKQRLFAALALVHDPEILFLDEFTTGMDPHARHAAWDMIRDIRSRGKTIFLTTHFMEEAEKLSDRVAIMDQGRLIALDTPKNLIDNLDAENKITFTVSLNFPAGIFRNVAGVTRVDARECMVTVYGKGSGLLSGIINCLNEHKIIFNDLRVTNAGLEDVFLTLTGKEIRN